MAPLAERPLLGCRLGLPRHPEVQGVASEPKVPAAEPRLSSAHSLTLTAGLVAGGSASLRRKLKKSSRLLRLQTSTAQAEPPPVAADKPNPEYPNVLRMLLKLCDTQSVVLTLIGMVIIATSKATGLAAPFALRRAVNTLTARDPAGLGWLTAFALLKGTSQVLNNSKNAVLAYVSRPLGCRLAQRLFAKLLSLQLQFHAMRRTGALLRRLERPPRAVDTLLRAVLFTFVPVCCELIVVAGLLFKKQGPAVAAAVLGSFAIYVLFTIWLSFGWVVWARKEENKFDDLQASRAQDALLNVEQVRLLGAARREAASFGLAQRGLQKGQQSSDVAGSCLSGGQQVITTTGLAVALWLVARQVCEGQASVGDIFMVQSLILQLWSPLQFLGFYVRQARQALVDLEDARELLSMPALPPDGDEGQLQELTAMETLEPNELGELASLGLSARLPVSLNETKKLKTEDGVPADAITGRFAPPSVKHPVIEFKDVSFSYLPEGPPVLSQLSFKVEAGSRVAVVGASGSGKTTIGRLATRLADPSSGQVLFCGVDAKELRPQELRSRLAVVPQDVVVFNDSLVRNLLYAKPGATDRDIACAIATSGLAPVVESLPEGLETVVGERGLRLSGGERQRLALARALLRAPLAELLLLDEATSALDSQTERRLMEALLEERWEGQSPPLGEELLQLPGTSSRHLTMLAITHRLGLAKQADEVLVIEHGRLVERGSHTELAARGGAYAALLAAAGQSGN